MSGCSNNSLDNSSPKLTKLTLSLSVKAVRVPISLYEDMLLTDNPIISKLGGELYFDKYLVIADESLDCVDFDFEYGVTVMRRLMIKGNYITIEEMPFGCVVNDIESGGMLSLVI